MKNIAVALDLGESSELLLRQAKVLAHSNNSKVWLLHVAAPDPDFVGYEVGPKYIRNDRADQLKKEHHQLADLKKGLVERDINAEALLIQGPIVQTLLEELDKLNIDLLIIGKKGHGLLYRAIMGSVFSAIVQKINIPLLAIPYLDKD